MNKGGTDKTCFVISPIGEENSDIRKRSDQIFSCVIEKAVTKFGYSPIRADKIPRPGIITSQIIEHILKDDLVVADLTGKNPNVFYELAIRHVVKKPFIQIKEVTETIPFDIAGMRTINVDYRLIVKDSRYMLSCSLTITHNSSSIVTLTCLPFFVLFYGLKLGHFSVIYCQLEERLSSK